MLETMLSSDTLQSRLEAVRQRIATSAERSHRKPQEITLIAVSKTHPADVLREAIAAGAIDFGENRVQETEEKIGELKPHANICWHLIGHLQANKARRAVRLYDVIHTVDSVELAERLDRLCVEENRSRLPVLVQVDLAGEASKSGIGEDELPKLVQVVDRCEQLHLMGLMTLPPFFEDVEMVRPYFRRLREWRDKLRDATDFGSEGGALSMGMSHDYEVAIEEGATMVRVGTAIFGQRPLTTTASPVNAG